MKAENADGAEMFDIHGQFGDSPQPARMGRGAGGGLPETWGDMQNPQAFATLMAQTMATFFGGQGTGHRSGPPDQYAKPEPPPSFNGFKPPIEEWETRLAAWEDSFPNLKNRGALLVKSLSGEAFTMITKTVGRDVYTREAQYDDSGELLVKEGYQVVKEMLLSRYKKRRIVQMFDKTTKLIMHTRRKGRPMRFYLQEFEVAMIDAESNGLKVSEELKGVFAVMFADLGPVEKTQVLTSMQAKCDAKNGEALVFEEVAAILQSVGDAATLSGAARPKQTLQVWQEEAEIDEDDQEWQGGPYDEVVEALGDFDEDPDAYTALLAQSLEGKSSGEVAVLVAKAMQGRGRGRGRGSPAGRGRGRSRELRRPPGDKKEATEKCSACGRPGHKPETCWRLHPELVPANMKERWDKAEEKRKQQKQKGTFLSALTLSSLGSIGSKADAVGLTDTGAEGDGMVAGTKWAGRYLQAAKSCKEAPSVVRVPASGNTYHFGAGNASAQATYKVPVWWGGRWQRKRLDVVGGVSARLPCLLGYDLQAEMGMVPVPKLDAVYKMDGTTLKAQPSEKVGGLLGLKLLGEHGVADARTTGATAKESKPTLHLTHLAAAEPRLEGQVLDESDPAVVEDITDGGGYPVEKPSNEGCEEHLLVNDASEARSALAQGAEEGPGAGGATQARSGAHRSSSAALCTSPGDEQEKHSDHAPAGAPQNTSTAPAGAPQNTSTAATAPVPGALVDPEMGGGKQPQPHAPVPGAGASCTDLETGGVTLLAPVDVAHKHSRPEQFRLDEGDDANNEHFTPEVPIPTKDNPLHGSRPPEEHAGPGEPAGSSEAAHASKAVATTIRRHPCLELDDRDLQKLHRAGHVPAQRLLRYMENSNSTPICTEDRNELLEKLKAIELQCPHCQRQGPKPMAPGAKLKELKHFNEEVVLDLVQLRGSVWALSLMDDGTKLKVYSAVPDSKAYTAARIFIRDWVRHYGMPRKLLEAKANGYGRCGK